MGFSGLVPSVTGSFMVTGHCHAHWLVSVRYQFEQLSCRRVPNRWQLSWTRRIISLLFPIRFHEFLLVRNAITEFFFSVPSLSVFLVQVPLFRFPHFLRNQQQLYHESKCLLFCGFRSESFSFFSCFFLLLGFSCDYFSLIRFDWSTTAGGRTYRGPFVDGGLRPHRLSRGRLQRWIKSPIQRKQKSITFYPLRIS